jgi:hypothetical protein
LYTKITDPVLVKLLEDSGYTLTDIKGYFNYQDGDVDYTEIRHPNLTAAYRIYMEYSKSRHYSENYEGQIPYPVKIQNNRPNLVRDTLGTSETSRIAGTSGTSGSFI